MTPQKKFNLAIILSLAAGLAGYMGASSAELTLDQLTPYEGTLESLKMSKTHDVQLNSSSPILLFNIKGLDEKLGIISNGGLTDFSVYQNKLKPGDIIKVYYQTTGLLTSEGYNDRLYQIEKNGEVLLDLKKSEASELFISKILFAVSALGIIASFWYFFVLVRAKKPVV